MLRTSGVYLSIRTVLQWREHRNGRAGVEPGEIYKWLHLCWCDWSFCVSGTEPVCVLLYREDSKPSGWHIRYSEQRPGRVSIAVTGPTPANLANRTTGHHRQCWQIRWPTGMCNCKQCARVCVCVWAHTQEHTNTNTNHKYHRSTFNNPTFCPHRVIMCFVWIWEQTAIISLYSINWLVFVTEI